MPLQEHLAGMILALDRSATINIDEAGGCRHVDLRSTGNHVVRTGGTETHLRITRSAPAAAANSLDLVGVRVPAPTSA